MDLVPSLNGTHSLQLCADACSGQTVTVLPGTDRTRKIYLCRQVARLLRFTSSLSYDILLDNETCFCRIKDMLISSPFFSKQYHH